MQDRLKQFRVLDRLGQGGSSEVFSAKDPFGQLVAIKIQRRPRKRPRFMQEYHILNKNLHPSLVKVHEFGLIPDGWAYLILQLIEGKSATAYVRSFYGRERYQRSIVMAAQISEAFGALHEIGWIHGDIKSKNILVDQNQIPHLIDFELSRPIEDTGNKKFFGTRSYAPPEQHEGKKLSPSVDVYAMAGVLYRCITNKLPFEQVEKEQQAAVRKKPPQISKRLPANLRHLLIRALDPNPINRPANGIIFAKELLDCLPQINVPIQASLSTPPPILHIQKVLRSNNLPVEKHILDILSYSGSNPSLISQFAYSKVNHEKWITKEYQQQVWHYVRKLDPKTQEALYFLAAVGGVATISNLRKFTGKSKRFLEEEFLNLSHWMEKEGHRWHLHVGATHDVCQYLVPHEEGLARLQEIKKYLPRWSAMFVDCMQNPASILISFRNWILGTANTLFQWRLLKRLQEFEYPLPMLQQILLFRRNGDIIKVLEAQQTEQADRILELYHSIDEKNIHKIQELTQSKNIDVSILSQALCAEWALLHADFETAEKYILPLCDHSDPYPRLIGLQQRALLCHHLAQFTRLKYIYEEIEAIATYPMVDKIKELIAEEQWVSNLLSRNKITSAYLTAKDAIDKNEDPTSSIVQLRTQTSAMNLAFLAVHPDWYSYCKLFALPPQPQEEEFRYSFSSDEDFSCS